MKLSMRSHRAFRRSRVVAVFASRSATRGRRGPLPGLRPTLDGSVSMKSVIFAAVDGPCDHAAPEPARSVGSVDCQVHA